MEIRTSNASIASWETISLLSKILTQIELLTMKSVN